MKEIGPGWSIRELSMESPKERIITIKYKRLKTESKRVMEETTKANHIDKNQANPLLFINLSRRYKREFKKSHLH